MLNFIKMILIAVAGVYLLLYPIELLNSAIYVLGVVIAIYGLLTCLAYFIQRGKKDQNGQNKRTLFSLLISIFALVCGIFMICKPDVVSESFPIIAGIFVLAAGILSSAEAVGKRNEFAAWKSKLAFALATVALGAILIFCKFDQGTTVRMLGTIMLYIGALGAVESRSEEQNA